MGGDEVSRCCCVDCACLGGVVVMSSPAVGRNKHHRHDAKQALNGGGLIRVSLTEVGFVLV
jgi:hypothetical protein